MIVFAFCSFTHVHMLHVVHVAGSTQRKSTFVTSKIVVDMLRETTEQIKTIHVIAYVYISGI